ncbi:MAG TPA: FkbM family methyltransferase [Pseudonocardiaceae bacterium]|nr:FkbM family methyltransferase [Pseudonocardiaceae bacterium]
MTDAVPEPADTVPLTAATVATVAELPAARVLRDTFTAHHPGAEFHILLSDARDSDHLHPRDLGFGEAELARLRTACSAAELRAVLRPRLIRWLLGSASTSGPVLYLDPQVLVMDSIAEPVLAGLVEHSLVLLPRVLSALPEDGRRPAPAELRAAGLFDPALIAANRGAEDFLVSWAEHAIADPASAAAFLDGAAVLTEHHMLRDPGIGLSVWNAGQRELTDTDGTLLAAGQPLRTAHLTGFDPARPWLLSAEVADRPRVLLSQHRPLARLCARYVNLLAEAADPTDPTAVDQRIGSARLPAALRAQYRAEWLAAERTGTAPPPALTADATDFLAWACAPVADQSGSTRWAAALWESDVDLRRRFAEPFGTDAAGFREWCSGTGVPTGRLPHEAIPVPATEQSRLTDQLGVSVLGEGPVADLVRAAATASGLPVSDRPQYPVLVCCGGFSPSQSLLGSRYLITVPSEPAELTGALDEVWTFTRSARAELAGVVEVPVHDIGLPVPDPGEPDPEAREHARARLAWPEKPDALVFVLRVDYAHELGDNVLGGISAFLRAFPDRADVALLLIAEGAAEHPEAAERLRLAIAVDERARLVEDPDETELVAWLATADCLLAPHRTDSDGADRVALVLADAAVSGLPVLAGDIGVAEELLPSDSALLVDPSVDGHGPDPAELVGALRTIAEDPDALAELGRRGRTAMLRDHPVSQAGEVVRRRVEHAYHAWRARRAVDRVGQNGDPLRPLRSARHVLLRSPDVGVGHKIPMAPALRKAVLRVLNHYDTHLRTVLGTLVDGVERSVQEVVRRQDAISAEAGPSVSDDVDERLDALTERVTRADAQLTSVDDGLVRARADLAGQSVRLGELEDIVVSEAGKRGKQVDALAERLDRLTAALDRTLDRIDVVESRLSSSLRDQDVRTEAGVRAAGHALRTADALRRVVLREHERRAQDHPAPPVPEQPPSSMVLCDAGLLRLPADDGVMLPLLSSNGVWEPELSALIDSTVEPGGVFLDIGAYVGYHTVRVLSRLGASGTVVAVEPEPGAVELLRHNVSVNVPGNVADRLVVLPAAAWDSSGSLAAESAMTGGVSVRPLPAAAERSAEKSGGSDGEEPGSAPGTVSAVRLDKEFENISGLDGLRLSVVKVDTPGRGHRALGGLVRLLRRDRPHVFCAFSATRTSDIGDDPATVLREFGTWGYDVVLLGEQEPSTPERVLEATENQHSTTLWLRPRTR